MGWLLQLQHSLYSRKYTMIFRMIFPFNISYPRPIWFYAGSFQSFCPTHSNHFSAYYCTYNNIHNPIPNPHISPRRARRASGEQQIVDCGFAASFQKYVYIIHYTSYMILVHGHIKCTVHRQKFQFSISSRLNIAFSDEICMRMAEIRCEGTFAF